MRGLIAQSRARSAACGHAQLPAHLTCTVSIQCASRILSVSRKNYNFCSSFSLALLAFRRNLNVNMKDLKPLLRPLDAGYRYRPHQMLNWFLDSTMALWGLPMRESVPEDISANIEEAIHAYGAIVHRQAPFQDVLGPLYMEMASHGAKQHLAQFFTPWSIARMLAMVNMAPSTAGAPTACASSR